MLQEHKVALGYVIEGHRTAAADAAKGGRFAFQHTLDVVHVTSHVDQLFFIESTPRTNIGCKEGDDLRVIKEVADGTGLLDKQIGRAHV